jgi:hypothetical protein
VLQSQYGFVVAMTLPLYTPALHTVHKFKWRALLASAWALTAECADLVQPFQVRTPRTYLPAALPFAFKSTSEAFRSAIRSTAGAGADFGVTVARV